MTWKKLPEKELTPAQKKLLENITPLAADEPEPPAPPLKQIAIRIHASDYTLLKRVMQVDKLKLQTIVMACIDAYILRDPHVLRIIRDWNAENISPRSKGGAYTFSHRERRDIFDEIAVDSPLEEPTK